MWEAYLINKWKTSRRILTIDFRQDDFFQKTTKLKYWIEIHHIFSWITNREHWNFSSKAKWKMIWWFWNLNNLQRIYPGWHSHPSSRASSNFHHSLDTSPPCCPFPPHSATLYMYQYPHRTIDYPSTESLLPLNIHCCNRRSHGNRGSRDSRFQRMIRKGCRGRLRFPMFQIPASLSWAKNLRTEIAIEGLCRDCGAGGDGIDAAFVNWI